MLFCLLLHVFVIDDNILMKTFSRLAPFAVHFIYELPLYIE